MFNPTILVNSLQQIPSNKKIWIAYSGGLDSHVLLHALTELAQQSNAPIQHNQLNAIHINHGWNKNAEQWSNHCGEICAKLNIPYKTIQVNARHETGESPEACARAARYAAFAQFIQPGDYLLTAHHQDDQAETLLVQLFRGAGVTGLAAMPELAAFAQGWHLRPLLNINRADLLKYAEQHELKWIEDDSNNNEKYTRNYLRHNTLKDLQKRWPNVSATLTRVALHCAEAAELIALFAEEDLKNTQGSLPNTLSCQALLKLNPARQKNILRHWIKILNFPTPSTVQLHHILQDILHSKDDACPKVAWDNIEIRRYQDNLFALVNEQQHDAKKIYEWDLHSPLNIPNIGVLTAALTNNPGVQKDILSKGKLTIRFRQSGERCHPAGRQGSHPLKKLFQEWQVPPWERDQIPLLYCNDKLVAVIGYCICAPFQAKAGQPSYTIAICQ